MTTTTTTPTSATPVAPLFRPAPVSGVGPDVDLLLALAGLSPAPAPSAAAAGELRMTAEWIAEAKRLHDLDPFRFANDCTDRAWSAVSDMCGGCGLDDCHPGELCPSLNTGYGEICGRCKHRHDQGLHDRECLCGGSR